MASRTFTVAQLATKARERADMVNSTFISDTELYGYISSSYCELYDLLVKSGLHYFDTTQSIVSDGTANVTLPTGYYGTVGVDYQLNSTQWVELPELSVHERNAFPTTGSRAHAYRIVGANLVFYPAPPSGQTYRHIYIPSPADLTSGATTVDGVSGWEEMIAVDVAIKCLLKEESDVSALMAVKRELMSRIEGASLNRAWAHPRVVASVRQGADPEVVDAADWRVVY